MGYGYVNHRASFRSATQTAADRLSVYGDHFHTGDTVGVLLDMNRGRLSFFLDGIKYGEHTVADLGEAFDGLVTPRQVRPRALYPLVGLSKNQDRIALSPRWLSIVGTHEQEELQLVMRTHELLEAWNHAIVPSADLKPPSPSPSLPMHKDTAGEGALPLPPLSGPLSRSMTPFGPSLPSWLLREGWRHWRRWRSNRFTRVRTRCRYSGPSVALDTTPRACVLASIRLGLPEAYFRGDRILFTKSSGRKLDAKEEAVILGAHNGKLWYRLESHSNNSPTAMSVGGQGEDATGGIMESGALAWSLVMGDVEGLTLLRRSHATSISTTTRSNKNDLTSNINSSNNNNTTSFASMMRAIADLPLPRIPTFAAVSECRTTLISSYAHTLLPSSSLRCTFPVHTHTV